MAACILGLLWAALPISSAHSNYHYHKHSPWKKVEVIATAYVIKMDSGCETYTARTSNGERPHVGTIATDRHIFPTGVTFYVKGYGFGRASDTGGGIRGYHIDLAMNTCHEAWAWGRRRITVLYLPPMKAQYGKA
jgi:3D (Asp-Asp-Asp) domain-containing protein